MFRLWFLSHNMFFFLKLLIMNPLKKRNSTFYIFHNPECASGNTQKNLQIVESFDVTLATSASALSPCPPALHLSAIPLLYLTHFLV